MQEINLLQNRIKDTTFAWEKQSRLVIGALAVILAIIVGLAAVFYFLDRGMQQNLTQATAQMNDLKHQLSVKQSTLGEAQTFQAQVANIKALVDSHTYITPLLTELSDMTYVKAQYLSLDADETTGKVHLEGVSPSYLDIGKLILGLSTSQKFTSVKLLSILPSTAETADYHFSIDVTVPTTIFTSNSK